MFAIPQFQWRWATDYFLRLGFLFLVVNWVHDLDHYQRQRWAIKAGKIKGEGVKYFFSSKILTWCGGQRRGTQCNKRVLPFISLESSHWLQCESHDRGNLYCDQLLCKATTTPILFSLHAIHDDKVLKAWHSILIEMLIHVYRAKKVEKSPLVKTPLWELATPIIVS